MTRNIRGEAPSMVLHVLATAHRPLRLGEITSQVDLAGPTVARVLRGLEEDGVVTGDLPLGQRRGQHVLYSLDHARLHAVLQPWLDYVTGADSNEAKSGEHT